MIASLGMDEERAAQLLSSDPALITEVLALVRRFHGSVAAYLVAHGVSLEEIEALRRELLEGSHDDADVDVDATVTASG
jgi:hypothetical protein